MSKPFNPADLTLSTTSSVGDLFTSSKEYVKNQTSNLSWEQIIIICLVVLLVIVILNNRYKDREISRQNSEINLSRSKSRNGVYEYDE